ncbi:putative E3 ubiquitin-protein ligase UBR7 [Impatiens glandulifera]|uniref:putative E3 ubiquitin-protein ligase UBR7 n=1 Tax=Impatiens glandulifera TaxID=253017 RepID=UPI001FB12C7B|nr:putative E3 ubiquitin-protein ligase UBR7 [Impatiens glandulifera]
MDDATGETTISIQEYLEEVEEQELEADLVLGGDEGKECTYTKGYMKRQAIFSCLTCIPDGNGGVCTACSLSCHDGHEIVELWTKRNFRCDCGNSKFGEFFCKLLPSKDIENTENRYNHNFKGLYCTCSRPYPDPDVEEQVDMIQCCICEDWFHGEHIGLDSANEIPTDEEGEPLYEDFICQECSVNCSVVTRYPKIMLTAVRQDTTLDTTKTTDDMVEEKPSGSNLDCAMTSPDHETLSVIEDITGETSLKIPESSSSCVLMSVDDDLVTAPPLEKAQPLFLAKGWRSVLCRCEKCTNSYKEKGIGFLLDREDSIFEYEKLAKEKRDEKLQQQEGVELNFLDRLGHVEKMEILSGIADMKNELHSFMESFDPSKTITSEDVHQVFENLAKKRRRM